MSKKGLSQIWNEEKDNILRELYAMTPCGDIADVIGCGAYTVSLRAKKLGLKRSPDYNQHIFKGRYTHKGRYKKEL